MTLAADHLDLRRRLVDLIRATGHLSDPTVAEAFAAVPRHPFAPAVYAVNGDGMIGEVLHGDRSGDARAYLDAVYSDTAIVTQVAPDGRPTSSSTQPGVMAVMLEALDLRPGLTALEVGTGTGYNAALLSHLLGDQRVTTVDIDEGLVREATAALRTAGSRPTVAVTDGLSGYAPRAPYDRIIATCSVRRVPAAWLRQTAPGGIVLANLSYGVVPLRVGADGSGSGRFLPQVAAFIEARPADGPVGPTTDEMVAVCMSGVGDIGVGTLQDARWFLDPRCEFFWRLAEPSIYQCSLLPAGEQIHCLVDAGTGSWARVHQRRQEVSVAQGGSRRVWDDIVTACRRWDAAGRPTHDRLGLTVTVDGVHTLWVDRAASAHRWVLG